MVQLLFAVRYERQLRRTHPSLIEALESAVFEAVKDSGGVAEREHKHISAVFDESGIAFWFELAVVLDTVRGIAEQAKNELHGYACVVGRDIPEEDEYTLLRDFSSAKDNNENEWIWCAEEILDRLEPYAVFGGVRKPGKRFGYSGKVSLMNFAPLRSFALQLSGNEISPCLEGAPPKDTAASLDAEKLLSENGNYALILGPETAGGGEEIYQYCRKRLGDFPPLVFRFGAGGKGVSCFADAFDAELCAVLEAAGSKAGKPALDELELDELRELRELLSRERLRDEVSSVVMGKARRFLGLLLDGYRSAASQAGTAAMIILENIHDAHAGVLNLFLEKVPALVQDEKTCIYCASRPDADLSAWRELGFRIVPLRSGEAAPPSEGDEKNSIWSRGKDLWEIACFCFFLRPYFPPGSAAELFREEGKNPRTVTKVLALLAQLRIINSPRDPRLRIDNFETLAVRVLGERRLQILEMVRRRLLAWVALGRISPCYRLLYALSRLGGTASQELALDSVYLDTAGGIFSDIDGDLAEGRFSAVAGEGGARPLEYIYRTLRALCHGDEREIRTAFSSAAPEGVSSPRYRAHILLNLATWQLGVHELAKAAASVKEAMLLCQSGGGTRGLARSYRLYSLVNLSLGKLDDAMDYLGFALENAEREGDLEELAVTGCYAAGAYFLYGNISRAERLAADAETAAGVSGQHLWASRARFLRGRMRFESGRYRDALEIFQSIERMSDPLGNETLDAWINRTKVYMGSLPPEEILGGIMKGWDGTLFGVEAAGILGRYEVAVELADRLLLEFPADDFPYIEQPDWRSAYAQNELLIFPKREFRQRLAFTLKALALSRKGLFPAADPDAALRLIQDIIRDDRFPDADPNDAFYYFSQYAIMERSGASEVDMNTAVSIAFNRMQRRASRIDDIETKRCFLSLNQNNAALMEAARKHKLI